jgi:hypothetical protein
VRLPTSHGLQLRNRPDRSKQNMPVAVLGVANHIVLIVVVIVVVVVGAAWLLMTRRK